MSLCKVNVMWNYSFSLFLFLLAPMYKWCSLLVSLHFPQSSAPLRIEPPSTSNHLGSNLPPAQSNLPLAQTCLQLKPPFGLNLPQAQTSLNSNLPQAKTSLHLKTSLKLKPSPSWNLPPSQTSLIVKASSGSNLPLAQPPLPAFVDHIFV